jgi:hypothetical protein
MTQRHAHAVPADLRTAIDKLGMRGAAVFLGKFDEFAGLCAANACPIVRDRAPRKVVVEGMLAAVCRTL